MKTATQLFKTAKLEMILAISLGAILWLIDVLVNGPWWLLMGFLVWTLTRTFDKMVGWPRASHGQTTERTFE